MTEKEKSRKEIEDEVAILVALLSRLDALSGEAFGTLYDMAKRYDFLGDRFSFKYDAGLMREYMAVLEKLRNAIMTETENAVSVALDTFDSEHKGDVQAAAVTAFDDNGWGVPHEKIDKQCSRWGDMAEAFIAAALLTGTGKETLLMQFVNFMDHPQAAPVFKGSGTMLTRIADAAGKTSKGVYSSPMASIRRIIKYTFHDAFSRGKVADMTGRGYLWYRCFRNSTYDCPSCDEVCAVPHRMTDIVLPVHAHCVCGMYPITEDEL